jgi:sulfoxide reductase heme-binding subunit YedZ
LTGEVQWIRPRRIIGLFAFGYALLHFVIYAALELGLDFSDLAREIVKRPFIIVGTFALLLLIPLAVTSTGRMMRRLGRRWQTVHRLVYPATILAVWHFWWQVKKDLTEPMLYAAALALLLGFRWWRAQALRNAQASNTQRGT